jgi:hypothetical protein
MKASLYYGIRAPAQIGISNRNHYLLIGLLNT